jgi:hypothetical protein
MTEKFMQHRWQCCGSHEISGIPRQREERGHAAVIQGRQFITRRLCHSLLSESFLEIGVCEKAGDHVIPIFHMGWVKTPDSPRRSRNVKGAWNFGTFPWLHD